MMNFINNISIIRKIALLMSLIVFGFIFLVSFYIVNSSNLKVSSSYETTHLIISTILFSFILSLGWLIIKNIKELVTNLHLVVENKTKELQELNAKLEIKVKEEVEKNREKDKIMHQHAKLATMGEMIGNIAHQWRQPLNSMSLIIQSFGIKSMKGPLKQEFIDKQVEEGLRISQHMSETIDGFRNFFKPSESREYFNIEKSLNDTISFLEDNDINITILAEQEFKMFGFANEFSQVIINFLNNSIDNFKQQNINFEKNILIKIESYKKDMIKLVFIDNGGGIPKNNIDKIFEPYFTTKHKSFGTGIGLYMSQQIIEKQMQGSIEVQNIIMNFDHNSYKCAQFTMILPIKQRKAQKELFVS